MLRRISVRLLAALLTVGLSATVALAAPPDNKGACDNAVNPDCAEEDKETGSPDDPNAWGSVASQLGDAGVMGAHSSDPVPFVEGHETPRDGLGNVARNDATDHGTSGSCSDPLSDPDNCDTGDNISDHACIASAAPLPGISPRVQPDCTAGPGKSPDPDPVS